MKITNLNCPHCGASLNVEGEGRIECQYCHNLFFAEEEKAPITMNTVIHHYHSDEESEPEVKNPTRKLIFSLISVLLLCVMLPFFFMRNDKMKSEQNLQEDQACLHEQNPSGREEDLRSALSYCAEGLEDIGFLREMSSLKELELKDCGKIKDYSVLVNMPGLERLTLYGAKELVDMNFVKSMSALKSLRIEGSAIEELAPLEGKLSLTVLELENNSGIKDFSVISTLGSLKRLEISPCPPSLQPDVSGLKFLEEIKFDE